jgi:hypothetical protein
VRGRRAGLLGQEEAASMTDVPNIRQKGTRLGDRLTREQAKELLAVPNRSSLKRGKPSMHCGPWIRFRCIDRFRKAPEARLRFLNPLLDGEYISPWDPPLPFS